MKRLNVILAEVNRHVAAVTPLAVTGDGGVAGVYAAPHLGFEASLQLRLGLITSTTWGHQSQALAVRAGVLAVLLLEANGSVLPHFLSNHPPEQPFKVFAIGSDVVSQCLVDHCLVTAAPGIMNAGAEPVEDIVIDPDGNPGLARRGSDHRPSFALAEVVSLFHGPSLYCRCSSLSAFLAEISRIRSPRIV